MIWQDAALMTAGAIGAVTAVIHGVLTQRVMVVPLDALMLAGRRPPMIRRLVPALLQFSTASWLLGGAALAASVSFSPDARMAIGLLVGGHYLYGAVGNLWATQGRHPGWVLMAVACGLIAYGLFG